MLTKRVIPCLDVKDGRVVKGVNFVSLRDAGDPVELAAAYDRAGADEVVFLDITATSDGRATTIDMASHASEELSIPYAVGGGFRDLAGATEQLDARERVDRIGAHRLRQREVVAVGRGLARASPTGVVGAGRRCRTAPAAGWSRRIGRRCRGSRRRGRRFCSSCTSES